MEAIGEPLLAVLFFIVSFAYSSVGLAGGSSYTALMAIFGVDYAAIPTITLTLNIIVSSVGAFNFARKGHARINLILPFLVSSIPMAYVGGSLGLSRDVFYGILLVSLLFVAMRIYAFESTKIKLNLSRNMQVIASLIAGSILGFAAGTVGIGGGIYLVPLIIILGLGSEKEAAACGVFFIWVNSISGLLARVQHNPVDLGGFAPLIIVVLIGGAIGSHLGSTKLSPRTMEKVLGLIVIAAMGFLAREMFF